MVIGPYVQLVPFFYHSCQCFHTHNELLLLSILRLDFHEGLWLGHRKDSNIAGKSRPDPRRLQFLHRMLLQTAVLLVSKDESIKECTSIDDRLANPYKWAQPFYYNYVSGGVPRTMSQSASSSTTSQVLPG